MKVFGGYGVIILAISFLILILSFSTIRSHYQKTLAQELEYLGRALNVNVLSFVESGRTQDLDAFLKKIGKEIHARVTIIDPQGVVQADTEKDPGQMENHRYRPEVAQALEGRIGHSLRFSYTVEEKMLYVGLPLEKDGKILGVLRLSLFMKNIDVLLGGMRRTIGWAILIVAFASLLLALFFSLHFTRPIHRLTKAARQVAGGEFETKVSIRHKDEFRELGQVFNMMTDRLRELFAEVSRQRGELAQTIASIREGLVVLDKDGRVALANDSFKVLIGDRHPEKKFHWEVIRKPKIQEFIGRAMTGGGPLAEEVRFDDRYFLCTTGALGPQGGVIITFHDLTELKKVEAIKKDFIVNASHELRTPLAAIMGAVEILDENAAPADKAAFDILKRHAARLHRIVVDLLKISELEDKGISLDFSDVDVRRLVENVLQVHASRIKDKGLEASLETPPTLPPLRADPYQLEQILLNLVDNAVKFTEKGRIQIRLAADQREFLIEVKDTGPGIPAEHLPRIFERFYVVDKSRSRKLGGTGLGLSIVKHIVELHGGSVAVQSAEGQGTTFTIRLPLYKAAST